jgi:hypothetical protein
VVEMTAEHPQSGEHNAALWRRFWGIERPRGPTWRDALAVLRETGLHPGVVAWQRESRFGFRDLDDLVAATRRRLCLSADRDSEVRDALLERAIHRGGRWLPAASPSRVITMWW